MLLPLPGITSLPYMTKLTESRYRTSFVLATSLFFMWGFARNILSVLNKHFQEAFSVGIAESAWVEVSTFLAYFLMAIPAGWAVSRWGYKLGMVMGLGFFALGCMLFIPSTMVGTFGAFVAALFVVAVGLVFLEVAANPYVTRLGPAETSSARLNRAQSFNGLGGILAPVIAGGLLFSEESASAVVPYTFMGIFVALIAVIFSHVQIPEIDTEESVRDKRASGGEGSIFRVTFVLALVALLAYEIAEICINSYFINFFSGMGWMSAVSASTLLSVGLLLFMMGRLVGSWLMQQVPAIRVLCVCSVGTVVCMACIVACGNLDVETLQPIAIAALMLNFLFESIMFPTIYSLALENLPPDKLGRAGSILMMTPVGGCSFLLMGMLADSVGGVVPFLLPLLGYVVVMLYAFWRLSHNVRFPLAVGLTALVCVCTSCSENRCLPYVDTMIGTGAHYSAEAADLWGSEGLARKPKPLPTSSRGTMAGYDNAHDPGQCIPAVLSPHGMNFWVAQTEDTEQKGIAPYYYADEEIQGFRGSHWLVGSMTQDYGSFTLMPLRDSLIVNPLERASRFCHSDEVSTPAYYSVSLLDYGIRAEMTGDSHSAIFRFTYQEAGDVYLVVNPNSDEGEGRIRYDASSGRIEGANPVHRIYQGKGEYAGFDGHFVVTADKAILEGGVCDNAAYLKFHVEAGEEVLVKAASSFVDIPGASRNLDTEIPDWDFEAVRSTLAARWEQHLGRVEVRSQQTEHLTQFYTALYHASFLPHEVSDCDGTYPSFAGNRQRKHTDGIYYDDYSMWDTYRAQHPLLCLLHPEMAGHMVQSLIDKYEDGGWLPIFPCWNSYTSEMIGDHCCSLVADAWFKGVRNFDIAKGYEALVRNATQLPDTREEYVEGKGRRALDSYLRYGFIPVEDPVADAYHKAEQTSRTLEYAYDDYCLACLSYDLGDTAMGNSLMQRADSWRNLFNPSLGWVDGRHADSTWVDGDPFAFQPYICEGKPCHYTFYVPHDVSGLIDMMGGVSAFAAKLDTLFDNALYWHGNEPCHQIAYLYNYAGRPWKTQQQVRRIMEQEYALSADGLSGNDDAGQMSAWYVFSAMGFYPVCPGKPEYALGTPLFEEVTLHLDSGNDFRIVSHNASTKNVYVARAELNGQPLASPFLQHEDVAKGGILELFMSPTPR